MLPTGFYVMCAAFMIAVGVLGMLAGIVALFTRTPMFGAVPPPTHTPEIDWASIDRSAPPKVD